MNMPQQDRITVSPLAKHRLILPDMRYLASYVAALREGYFFGIRPTTPEEEIQKIEQNPYPYFEEINRQGGKYTPRDGVERRRLPYNHYWLVEDEAFIGATEVRYESDDFIHNQGGQIGYGIRPCKQGQGYGSKILSLALDKAREQGMTQVVIAVDDENIPSIKAIEANGGIYLDKKPSIFFEGHNLCRYQIDIIKKGDTA